MRAAFTAFLIIGVLVLVVGGSGGSDTVATMERGKTERAQEETNRVSLTEQWSTERTRLREEGESLRARYAAETRLAAEEGRTQRQGRLLGVLPVVLVIVFAGMTLMALTVLRPDTIAGLIPVLPGSVPWWRFRLLTTAQDPRPPRVVPRSPLPPSPEEMLEMYARELGLSVVPPRPGDDVYLLVDGNGVVRDRRRLLEG